MEALWKSLRKGSSWTEIDVDYEDIEAPKFVDFTAPDFSRPDNSSWFCSRIGCAEDHDEVDPEVLHKNFVLRVMAARSPNLKLQKALIRHHNRQYHPREKCPQSEPEKRTKSRLSRLTEKTTISSKLKKHPITGLNSSTPKTAKKKQMIEEASRSLKINREIKTKNSTVAKVLGFHTPKKSEESELAARMRKLEISGLKPENPNQIQEVQEQSLEFDENKENTSVMENQPEKTGDVPQKAMGIFGKNQSKPSQGIKCRALKPTNPKPFRLRTEERGILREKKPLMEKTVTVNPQRAKTRSLDDQRRAPAVTTTATAVTTTVKRRKLRTVPKNGSPAVKKSLTVPRAPTFTKVNVPKCCVKRCHVAT